MSVGFSMLVSTMMAAFFSSRQGELRSRKSTEGTDDFLIHWSISERNTQVNPTTCLGDTDCWIQQVTAPTLVVTCWIQ